MKCQIWVSRNHAPWLLMTASSLLLLAGCGVNEFDRRYNDRLTKLSQTPAVASPAPGPAGGQTGVPAEAPPVVPGTVTPSTAPGTPTTGAQELLGTWKITSVVKKGAQDAQLAQVYLKLIFQGDEISFSLARGDSKHRFTADATKTPKWIDVLTVVNGAPSGQIMTGIYELSGQTARIALLPPAAGTSDTLPRPTGYDTSPTEETVVYILEREN